MPVLRPADLWWKNAVVYCLDVETYLDRDGDGCGDLRGVTERLDYLQGIGVTCLWLLPFYRSPGRDDGYDISDHYAVQERHGTLGDVVELVREARERGIRVIADLVVNHTSDEHPWFQRARSSRDDPYRSYYVWADEPPEDAAEPMFPGEQDSTWTHDERTDQWYLHHFYDFQPDLNIRDPRVRDELARVIGFWLELGLSGFRVDAVPFFVEGDDDAQHELLRELNAFVTRRRGDAVLLGEVNVPYEDVPQFFGDHGDELQMLFDFPLMQAMHLAFVRHDAAPVAAALRARPELGGECQWAVFARNHDELTLDQLSESERQEVFEAFAPDEGMRLYGRGIRRRVPTMVDGDQRRMRLAYSLVLGLPGTPVLFYGEEVGMGENLDEHGRLAVRTPMQWAPGPTGGFTTAPADRLVRRPPDGPWSPDAVNAAAQRRDPGSLLNWFEAMIRRRKECPELGWGRFAVLDAGDSRVLAVRCDWETSCVVTVHNFAAEPLGVRLPVEPPEGVEAAVDLLGDHGEELPLGDGGVLDLDLEPYGYRWFRLRRRGDYVEP